MAVTGVSMEVNAEIADMRTSSLTRTFPCTSVCVRGDGGTVIYVDTCVRKKPTYLKYMKNDNLFKFSFGLKITSSF